MVTTDLSAPPFTLDVRVARSPLVGFEDSVATGAVVKVRLPAVVSVARLYL